MKRPFTHPPKVDFSPTAARQTAFIVRSVERALETINAGKLIEDISVTTTASDFPHKLGREIVGWIVVDIDDDARVWSPGGEDREKFVRLQASSPVNVTLWVF